MVEAISHCARVGDAPQISVIIPCYNREKYIEAAILSALREVGEREEVILVDDGSVDRSVEIARKYEDRITIVTGPNRGVSAARNRGVQVARGDYLVFLDSDDLLPPGALEEYRRQLRGDPRVILIGKAEVIDEHGHRRSSRNYAQPIPVANDELKAHEVLASWAANWACLIPRSLFEEAGGYDPRVGLGEDYDLNSRMLSKGARYRRILGVTYQVREHPQVRESKVHSEERLARLHEVFTRVVESHQASFASVEAATSRIKLARWIWSLGRVSARTGHLRLARDYFNLALSVAGRSAYTGSSFSRLLYHFLDPIEVERLLSSLKAIRGAWLPRPVQASA